MIIIAGTVDVAPDRRAAALEAARAHMAETRKLPGCLDYVWSADPMVEGRIYVFERWADRAALEHHFASAHFPAMRDTIAAHRITGLEVWKYRGDVQEPVYDPTGRPRADFFTLDEDQPSG